MKKRLSVIYLEKKTNWNLGKLRPPIYSKAYKHQTHLGQMGLLLKLTVLEACVMPFMPKTLSAVDWYKTIYITAHCHWILSDFVAWYGLCYSQIMDPNCDFSLAGSLFPCITLWRVTTSVGYRLHWNKYWYSCQDYVSMSGHWA